MKPDAVDWKVSRITGTRMEVAALVIVVLAVLIGPLLFKSIEHKVEMFFSPSVCRRR
jgi:hypothetical protein